MSQPSIDAKLDQRSQGFVLVINAGTSSLKFSVFRRDLEPDRLLSGVFDRIDAAWATFAVKLVGNPALNHKTVSAQNHAGCLDDLLMRLEALTGTAEFLVVVHRIVHKRCIAVYGEDMPEITDWRWPGETVASESVSTS